MGTALFQRRHYEKIAEYLNDMNASDTMCFEFCVRLYRDNKYFKPRLFLEICGMSANTIKMYMKEISTVEVNYV